VTETPVGDALPKDYTLHWYRIDGVLGQGGFGITYLAHDSNLDQPVAIKEYLPFGFAARVNDSTVAPRSGAQTDYFRWGLERFISEARTLAKFDHPNIVRVHSVFEFNDTAYMVMRYEQGESLDAILEQRGTLEEKELLDILLPVLDGLREVHDAGFIHRDIKPANIYLRDDGSPVLLDFGAARQASGRPKTVTILLAPGYAPFEQYYSRGDRQGPWTDIYSLGATLYRGIASVVPIDAIERSKGILGSTRDILVPAALIGKGRYSPGFLEAVDHALKFIEKERPQRIEEWLKELRGELQPEPVVEAEPADAQAAARNGAHPVSTPARPGDTPAQREASSAPSAGVPAARSRGVRRFGWRWTAAIAAGVALGGLLSTLIGDTTDTGLPEKLRKELAEIRAQVATLNDEKSALLGERASLQAGLKQTQSDMASSKADLQTLSSRYQQLLTTTRALEAELKALQDQEKAQRLDLAKGADELAEMGTLQRSRTEELAGMKTQLEQGERRLSSISDEAAALGGKRDRLLEKIGSLEQRLEARSGERSADEERAAQRKRSLEQESARLENSLALLDDLRRAEEHKLDELKGEHHGLVEDIDRLKKQQKAESRSLGKLTDERQKMERKLALLRNKPRQQRKAVELEKETGKQERSEPPAIPRGDKEIRPATDTEAPPGELAEAMADWKSGDFEAALKKLRPLARVCVADAQIRLAEMYEEGLGMTKKNAFKAYLWYRAAEAKAGEIAAAGMASAAKDLQPAQVRQADSQ